jgi:hypothetical protein
MLDDRLKIEFCEAPCPLFSALPSQLLISKHMVLKFPHSISVGLKKILSLLESEEPDVRVHAVKVVANLAAEGECYLFIIVLFVHGICYLSMFQA